MSGQKGLCPQTDLAPNELTTVQIRTYETDAERRIFASWPLERIAFERLRLVGADYYREWVPKLILDESHLVCTHQAVVWDV